MQDAKMTAFLVALLCALLDGEAPSGHVYAVLMTQDIEYDQYMRLVAGLQAAGFIQQRHDVLSLTPKGRDAAARLDRLVA